MALDIAHYLQEHVLGEVTASPEVRRYFAHDGSILQMAPTVVVYPRNEDDIRKTLRFSWQLAERGRIMPVTARGGGTNTSGAAIGSGILLAFTAHMNKLLVLNDKKALVSVEPGITYDKLQQTLYTHDLFFPIHPAAGNATIGGAIASNTAGEKAVKYGTMQNYVDRLRVVLANGEVIETRPLKGRELNKKLGLSSLEGNIYRSLDALLEENAALIAEQKDKFQTPFNAAGYNIFDVKKNGEFNLTPLLIGSQGTLAIISETIIKMRSHNPSTKLALISLEKLEDLSSVLPQVLKLKPSLCDMINRSAVEAIGKINPSQLVGVLDPTHAAIHLFVEFNDSREASQKHAIKSLKKITESVDGYLMVANTPEDQEQIWKIRHATHTLITAHRGPAHAIPVAEDIAVPVEQLVTFIQRAEEIYQKLGLTPAFVAQAGSGIVRSYPVLDLAQVGDRQKMFKLADAIYAAAVSLGGSITASEGDGRIRAPFTASMYGPEIYGLMMKVKKIFDPHGILNPGVKSAGAQDIMGMMRAAYSLRSHDHLPHI